MDFPDSPWKEETMLHLGCACEYEGRYQESATWFDGILATTPENSPMGIKTLLRRSALHVNQGNFDQASKGFAKLYQTATDPDHKTYASHWIREIGLLKQNEVAIRDCGQKALARVAEIRGDATAAAKLRAMDAAGPHGFNARELMATAKAHGLDGHPVQAGSALASLPLPMVAHYHDRHFVTVENVSGGMVTLHDSRVGRTHQIPESSFHLQWSGFALLFAPVPDMAGITPITDNLDSIMGGCCGLPRYNAQFGNDPCAKKNCGLPGWNVNMVNMNFRVQDTPMWWNAPIGPAVHMSMLFNSLDALNNLEPFGPKWSFEYASYALIDPGNGVTIRDGDGRFERFTGSPSTYPYTYTSAPGDFRTLIQTASHAFDLVHQGGTTYRYGIAGLMQGASHVPLLLEIEDRHGNKVMIDHNAQGAITAIRHTAMPGQQWTLVYDENLPVSRVKRIDDPFGRSCHFTYDAQYRLTGQTDMGGLQYSYTYTVKNAKEGGTVDPELFVASITTPKGTTQIHTEPADGDDSIGTNGYPPANGPMWENYRITVTDQENNKSEYHYNGASREAYYRDPTQYVAGMAPLAYGSVCHRFDYLQVNGWATIKSITMYGGGSSPYLYRIDSMDAATRLPSRVMTQNEYSSASNWYAYNAKGNLTSIRLPKSGGYANTDHELLIEYAANGIDPLHVRRELDNQLKTLGAFTYHPNRDLHTATDALGRTLTYAWKTDGRLESVTDGLTSDIVLIEYDTGKRPSAIKLNGVTLATMAHDSIGRMLAQAEPDGDQTTYTYDNLDRLTSAKGPDNTITRWLWACCFLDEIRTAKIDGNSEKVLRRVKQTHDKRGLLTSTIDTSGNILRYAYDAAGRLANFTDALENMTSWTRDSYGRVISKHYADSTSETFAWYNMNQIYSQTNRRGQATIFNYDLSGNVESVASPTTTIATAYDNWDRPSAITLTGTGDTGTHTITHDLLGRVLTLDGPWSSDSDKLTWTYNDAARQVIRAANGAEGSYTETTTADTLGRLGSIINPLGTFTVAYSGNTSRATAITHSGGFDTTFSYTGPEQGRALSGILSKIPGGATVAQHSYTYDQLGQIATWKREAQLANPGTTHQYEWTLAHDYSGQLTSAIEKSITGSLRDGWAFGYDAAGNRQSATRMGAPGATAQAMTANHNLMNQITTLGGGGKTLIAGSLDEPGQVAVGLAGQGDKPARMLASNRFETELDLPAGTSTLQITATDASANTTQKQYTVATAPETARTFTHDADGNLISDGVRTYEWDALSRLTKITWAIGKTTDISYNALGQRSKLVHTDGGTSRTEYLLYDGAELLQRRAEGTAASNTDRVHFTQGERRRAGSTWNNHHYTRDHLGSVREVLDSSGSLLARYDYTPYGEKETRYEASGYEGTDFGFTGHITLESPVAGQTELFLAHFRAYDPLIGRWLSQDPIREEGGVNLYGYVGGAVAQAWDPLGRDAVPVGNGMYMFVANPNNFVDIYGKRFGRIDALIRAAETVYVTHPNENFTKQCATGGQFLTGTLSGDGKSFYDAPATPTWRQGPSAFGPTALPPGTLVARGWENGRYPSKSVSDYPEGAGPLINHVGILVRQVGGNRIKVLQQNPTPFAIETYKNSEDWHVVLSSETADYSKPSKCGIERTK